MEPHMARTIEEQIKAAEERERKAKERAEQLRNKREALERRMNAKLLKGSRADDTRRKILVGSMFLNLTDNDEKLRAGILARLDGYLTRDDDRALFDLPSKTTQPEAPQQPAEVQPASHTMTLGSRAAKFGAVAA